MFDFFKSSFSFCDDEDNFDWDSWDKKYPVGGKFKYLGAELIIIKNWLIYLGYKSVEQIPGIIANYKDKNGVLREIELSKKQCEFLEK